MNIKDHLDSLYTDFLCGNAGAAFNDDGSRRRSPVTRYERRMEGKNATSSNMGSALAVCKANILGFLLGCALMRLFGSHGSGYIVMGTLLSVVLGMVDCMIMRKMPLIDALVRNIILTVLFALVFLFFYVLTIAMDKI